MATTPTLFAPTPSVGQLLRTRRMSLKADLGRAPQGSRFSGARAANPDAMKDDSAAAAFTAAVSAAGRQKLQTPPSVPSSFRPRPSTECKTPRNASLIPTVTITEPPSNAAEDAGDRAAASTAAGIAAAVPTPFLTTGKNAPVCTAADTAAGPAAATATCISPAVARRAQSLRQLPPPQRLQHRPPTMENKPHAVQLLVTLPPLLPLPQTRSQQRSRHCRTKPTTGRQPPLAPLQ